MHRGRDLVRLCVRRIAPQRVARDVGEHHGLRVGQLVVRMIVEFSSPVLARAGMIVCSGRSSTECAGCSCAAGSGMPGTSRSPLPVRLIVGKTICSSRRAAYGLMPIDPTTSLVTARLPSAPAAFRGSRSRSGAAG